jgi:uncharacterized protein
MPEMTTYAPGTPCWVDLGTPDIDKAVDFYAEVLGWEVPPSENPEETGGYRIGEVGGKPAAGMMPLMQEGQPSAWTTYISTDDADATAAKVRDAGGQVVVEPMDVMDLGRMAAFTDPTGAFFGVWQAASFQGAGIVGESGAVVWNELNTRDPDRAKEFYGQVFGWETRPFESEGGPPYLTVHVGGEERGVAGIMDTRAFSQDAPPHWMVYFAVDDVDDVAERAKERGGAIAQEPMDVPDVGRIAVLHDPTGAHFAVLKPNPRQ